MAVAPKWCAYELLCLRLNILRSTGTETQESVQLKISLHLFKLLVKLFPLIHCFLKAFFNVFMLFI